MHDRVATSAVLIHAGPTETATPRAALSSQVSGTRRDVGMSDEDDYQ